MNTQITLRLATYPKYAGNEVIVHGVRVVRVPYGEKSDIRFQKFTKDHKNTNSRPFVTSEAAYSSLRSAVLSILKRRN